MQHSAEPLNVERLASMQQNTAISLLKRIPPEILAEIFSLTVPSPSEMAGFRSRAKHSPWILGQICSRCKGNADPLPLIETQLQRAHLLKVHFYGSGPYDPSYTAQIERFAVLCKHSARWEEFNVDLTAELAPHMAALHDGLPALRRLWVRWYLSDDVAKRSLRCLATAFSLVDVAMIQRGSGRVWPVSLPASHLTSYRIHCSWTDHEAILKLAPNITEARITIP
ncbi:hypothetical protein FB45DRAFT_374332 [Roridomyces roridus]|uniref:Uncharacterized protein n=1 Tax=Roridomyces roridus TaxID=1738132 RepID=A0AAD7FAX3_9AGAR|nr:hypothetical protein FB45DRAFT_374332 [Roridomyces roridus]